MGMNEKDIVESIVDKLKNMHDRPYKEGAWESYRSKKPHIGYIRRSKMWYAAASILLCFGIGFGLWWTTRQNIVEPSLSKLSNVIKEAGPDRPILDTTVPLRISPETHGGSDAMAEGLYGRARSDSDGKYNQLELLEEDRELNHSEVVSVPQLNKIKKVDLAITSVVSEMKWGKINVHLEKDYLTHRDVPQSGVLEFKSTEEMQGQKKIPLSDRFQLGLFVSPYATSKQMNVGGGLALSYKINKNLSLRTGASYNNYEIQTLKNPIEPSSTEIVPIAEVEGKVYGNAIATNSAQSKMIIPNINAITGFVKSVDIPLEVKINDNSNTYYAAGGLSYSAIFNQKREAHYVENLNQETFSDGYPENKHQAAAAVKPITRTIKSAEDNVNSKGFNGFVNLSVGRNIRMNNKVGLSIEPYIKVPIGQYRRADMDFTQGGIRVMTNF